MIRCKHCGNKKVVKSGVVNGRQRYLCKACNRIFVIGGAIKKFSADQEANQEAKVEKLHIEKVESIAIKKANNTSSAFTFFKTLVKTIKSWF